MQNIVKKVMFSSLLMMLLISNLHAADAMTNDAAHINMLEKALAPQNPDALAALFALANKERNGAVQYMMFSDAIKKQYKNNWPYWVSGSSSPWITAYKIKKTTLGNQHWQYQITYDWATAAGPFKPSLVQTIDVQPVGNESNSTQKFQITKLTSQ